MVTAAEIKAQEKEATRDAIRFAIIAFSIVICGILISMMLGENLGNWIVETPWAYCMIIWIVFAFFSSTFEAMYYNHEVRSSYQDNFNEHPLFVAIRSCVLIPLWIIAGWKVALCLGVMFPFFHDGQYYRFRNKIDPTLYRKKWFSQSTTSTAFSTKYFTPVVRTSLCILAFAGLILNEIYS